MTILTEGKKNTVISDINDHIKKCGGSYSNWYAGIATDPSDRLFNDHNVDKDNDAWVYRDCGTESAARAVEKHFLNLGCKGGPGGGIAPQYTYAYKINNHTRQ